MTPVNEIAELAAKSGWDVAPVWSVATRVDRTGYADAKLLSVYRDWGVVRKSDRDDNHNVESDDLSTYKWVRPGDLVLNKMKTWQGSLAVSEFEGIVSPAYFVCSLNRTVHPRYIHYLLRSDLYIAMYAAASKGIRPNQWDLPYDEFRRMPVLLPPLEEQRRIADFLDDQVTRIDRIEALRDGQLAALETLRVGELLERIFVPGAKRVPLSAMAEVRLGRQRSPERAEGPNMKQYLRSANVTDGLITLDGVLEMDFTPAEQALFALRSGDVLVTEGAGSPEAVGASALWDGRVPEMYFQNTLVRVRSRGSAVLPEYLGWWARTSHLSGAMRASATGANILHLGSQGLARMPIPALALQEQQQVVANCAAVSQEADALKSAFGRQITLLGAYKRSVITAAVTGQLDVTTARQEMPV